MSIRATTRADLFEEGIRQLIVRGSRVEDEQPIPVKGFGSFIAVNSWFRRSDGMAK